MAKKGPKPVDWRTKFPDFAVDVWYNESKFLARQYESPHGCIYMTGARHSQGYPMTPGFNIKTNTKVMMTAHRLAYKIAHGDPGDQQVLHTCSDMCCVNPAHLVVGDTQTRVDICIAAGRHNNGAKTRGSYNHKQYNRKYKHSEEEILWVRSATTDEIAAKYGMTKAKAAARKWSWTREYFQWLK